MQFPNCYTITCVFLLPLAIVAGMYFFTVLYI